MISASESGSFVSLDVGVGVWIFLSALIAVLLLVDLLVVHRNSHVMSTRRALAESLIWISIGLAFSFFVLAQYGGSATGEYLSAYLIEKSLSIDNVFVWSVILTHYRVPAQYQHRVLFWGIFGALAMRLGFILAGVAVIKRFEFTMVLFGAFLLWTGVKMFTGDDEFDPADSKPMKLFHRFIPSTDQLDGQKLITQPSGSGLHLLAPHEPHRRRSARTYRNAGRRRGRCLLLFRPRRTDHGAVPADGTGAQCGGFEPPVWRHDHPVQPDHQALWLVREIRRF